MKTQNITDLVLKAVAVGMGVASLVIAILNAAPVQVNVILLSIGVAALAIWALGAERSP